MSETLEYRNGALFDAAGAPAQWPRLALLGDPVAHSASPRMHDAALRVAKLDGHYQAVRVAPAQLESAAASAFAAGVTGLNLTIPHKVSILRCVERASEEVTRIGAANTLLRLNNGWAAHNTDARGFAMALQALVGRDLDAAVTDVHIIGAGGAARAVAAAIRSISISSRLRFLVRRPESVLWASEFGATVEPLDGARVETATLVVQATPLGLDPNDPSPLPHAEFAPGAVAMDLVYASGATAVLRQAAAARCRYEGGARMLVAQGALSFTMWFGGQSPLAQMAEAIGFDW